METNIQFTPIAEVEADALVVVAFEKKNGDDALAWAATRDADKSTGGWIAELYQSQEFRGKALDMATLHRPHGLKAKRLVAAGGGPAARFTPGEARKLAGAVVRSLKPKSIRSIAVALDGGGASPDIARAIIEGALLGDFEPDRYKTDKEKSEKRVDSFTIVCPKGSAGLEQAAREGAIIGAAQNFARELVNEPANQMNPTVLASRALQMAAELGLECEVLDQDHMRQLGMGALLGVAQGSAEPPALIVVRYRPAQATPGAAHLGLVGKGVTFDTGGISIKPAEGMEKMKYDMAGGAAVLGAMAAIAQLKPPIAVTAFVPAVENMPGSRAQRPGDIVTTLAGKTVEVLNTDAEGRLILIDALAYAKRLGCTHLVDAATLTGAIVVALGHVHVGAFTNDESFLDRLLAVARAEGEKMWPMPLDDEYKDYLKSAFADLPNIGGRWGGAITAAMFLREFVDTTPWVHLDIAGTAWLEESKPFMAKGPSGVGVRTFVRLATGWK